MSFRKVVFGGLLMASVTLAAGCESSKDRAEKYYQQGMALLAKGDVDRALVEFRNVFNLDGSHRDARRAYARAVLARGDLREAYGQYLRLVEQYPDDEEGNRELAILAVRTGNWPDAERYSKSALAISPSNPDVRAAGAIIAYRQAAQKSDPAAAAAAVSTAEQVVKDLPGQSIALSIIIDDRARKGDWADALKYIDAAIAANPNEKSSRLQRLAALEQLRDTSGVEADLRKLVTDFPDDAQFAQAMIVWYIQNGNPGAAEEFLRQRAGTGTPEDQKRVRLTLVQLLDQTKGSDAALAELDSLIAAGVPDLTTFKALRAGMWFTLDKQDQAIEAMRALIADSATPADERRDLRIALARMLSAMDNQVGAREQIETVLKDDPSNVAALKQRASWLIDDDKTGDAVAALRTALNQAPRDPELLTLMARAYERDGSRELMSETLALAVEASNKAPEQSLRYANVLLADGKMRSAEDVLIDALRQQPKNIQLLHALAMTHIRMKDWPRAMQEAQALADIGTPDAGGASNEITARVLAARNQESDLIAFLEKTAAKEGDSSARGAAIALIRSNIARGDNAAATAQLNQLLQKTPEDPSLLFVQAAIRAAEQDFDGARAILEKLIASGPAEEAPCVALYNLMQQKGDPAAAAIALKDAPAVIPDSVQLNLIQAYQFEKNGDVDGAIATYEKLYAADSNNFIVANNLASLLAYHRSDTASLEKASTVSRRLRSLPVPAYQDTYGWIAFRRGSYDEAVASLEPAAKGLPGDVTVQYHLARAYAAVNRKDEALAQYAKVQQMLRDNPSTPDWLAGLEADIAATRAAEPAKQGN